MKYYKPINIIQHLASSQIKVKNEIRDIQNPNESIDVNLIGIRKTIQNNETINKIE